MAATANVHASKGSAKGQKMEAKKVGGKLSLLFLTLSQHCPLAMKATPVIESDAVLLFPGFVTEPSINHSICD